MHLQLWNENVITTVQYIYPTFSNAIYSLENYYCHLCHFSCDQRFHIFRECDEYPVGK